MTKEDLQAIIEAAAHDLKQEDGYVHHVYDAARYANYIYEGAPQPALSPEDVAWAQQFVPSAS